MKIRTGFVSNSSSTSYTVAFVPEESNMNLKTFDFLLNTNSSSTRHQVNFKVFRDTVGNRRRQLDEEMKTLERDVVWLTDRVEKLMECSQIPGIQLIMNELDSTDRCDTETTRFARRHDKKEKWGDVIARHIQRYNDVIKQSNEQIEQIKYHIDLIKDLPDDTVVAKWEEDCGGLHMLSDLLHFLEPDGRVILLEKETT